MFNIVLSLFSLIDNFDLWIKNEAENSPNDLLTKMRVVSGNGLLSIADNLSMDSGGNCLGISYKRNESDDSTNITLHTWNCEDKKSVTCQLEITESIIPPKPAKFPCITDTREARKKRETQDMKNLGTIINRMSP